MFLNLKMHAWCDWGEWHQVFNLIFGKNQGQINENSESLKRALHILNRWLSKNVGGADHTKALKMQKLLIIEFLALQRYQKCK